MSKRTVQGGTTANNNGKMFEHMLAPVFQSCGLPLFKEKDTKEKPSLIENLDRYVLCHVHYTTIYGDDGYTEFVIVDGERRVRVEAKFQKSKGSVDEKFPHLFLNGVYAYPESEVMFVVDGNGFRPKRVEWLGKQIENNWLNYMEKGKRFYLMNLTEFINWVLSEFQPQ